ncbi:MAG: Uma2 family endonuclease [Anaerolineae bacterium]|nr:Uma2 family endonuclease [Anaerolineae bacterium]
MTATNAEPHTTTGLTAAELADLPTGMGERYELIEGKLIALSPAKPIHGFVAQRIASMLDAYNAKTNFGTQFTAGTGFKTRRDDRTVRAPDVSLISYKRLPMERLEDLGADFLSIAPELVVEVISEYDRASEIAQKTQEWLDFGVLMVWNVYPDTRQVYRHVINEVRVLNVDDALDGGDVLPDFQIPINMFFSKRKQES